MKNRRIDRHRRYLCSQDGCDKMILPYHREVHRRQHQRIYARGEKGRFVTKIATSHAPLNQVSPSRATKNSQTLSDFSELRDDEEEKIGFNFDDKADSIFELGTGPRRSVRHQKFSKTSNKIGKI